jgi:holo-[acyl-carrier protein] synthase
MILGIGTDLFDIDRMRRRLASDADFAASVFTPREIAYCRAKRDPAPHFAARFAAKEAVVKALADAGGRGAFWLDIEVRRRDDGRPSLELSGRLAELAAGLAVRRIHLSLTHTDHLAAATVVLEGGAAAVTSDRDDRRRR